MKQEKEFGKEIELRRKEAVTEDETCDRTEVLFLSGCKYLGDQRKVEVYMVLDVRKNVGFTDRVPDRVLL